MYEVKITLNNGNYYIKTMNGDELAEFKSDLCFIHLIELSGKGYDVIIFRDYINSIEIKER